MYLSATSEISVETSGADVSYLLPPRPFGKWKWLGLALVAFSVLFVWGPAHGLLDSIRRMRETGQPAFETAALFGSALFVILGCLPAIVGLMIIGGRSRVDWRDQRLSAIDYVGPIRWRRRLPRKPVRNFTVKVGDAKSNGHPIRSGPFANIAALMAEFEDGNRRVIVAGYPREWLTELAADLSTRVGASLSATTAPAVIVQDPRENPPELADAPRPAETTVKINSRPGGILIEIPPAGFRGFSRSLLTFAIVWCAIVALMGGMALFGKNRGSGFVGFIPFGLIGVGLIAFAQNLARRRTTFLVEGGRLKATQSGPFGTREREWQRNEIAAIRADASGMEVNERPVIDLQVHPIIGKKVGYLASRDENELRWIATELRRALNVPATTEPRTVPGDSFSKPKL